MTVATIMCLVVTFDITDSIDNILKLTLICRKNQEPLSKFKINLDLADTFSSMITIPLILEQTVINLISPQLFLDIQAADAFNSALLDSLDSRFIASKGFSNVKHTY